MEELNFEAKLLTRSYLL